MIKNILFLSTLFSFATGFSQITLNYGEDIDYGWGDAASVVTPYVTFPKQSLEPYKGNQITSIKIGVMEEATNCYVYIKNNPQDNENLYRQKIDNLMPGWNEIILDTPFDISGLENIAIGYKGSFDKSKGVGVSSEKFSEADNVYYNSKNTWTSTGGSICISAVVNGENLPVDELGIYKLTENKDLATNISHTYSGYAKNLGSNKINSYILEILVDDTPVDVISNKNLESGERENFTFTVQSDTQGAHTVEVVVKLVNGNPDIYTYNNSLTSTFNVRNTDFLRKVVCEEYTGTWCGWCPRGLVGLELMKERHPGEFFAISIHGGDEMQIDLGDEYDYSEYIGKVSGAPTCNVNRKGSGDPYYDIENLFALERSSDNHVNLSATGNLEDGETITVEAVMTSDTDLSGLNYNIAFTVTEDGITGYEQTNYYAGNDAEFYGWEKKDGLTSDVVFNDVARAIIGGYGGMEFFSGDLNASESFTGNYSFKVPSNVTNPANINVIAQIIDPASGYIVNSNMVTFNMAGVESIAQENNIIISARNNSIRVNGSCDKVMRVTVYSLDGCVKDNRRCDSSYCEEFESGLYVVVVSCGDKIIKRSKVIL